MTAPSHPAQAVLLRIASPSDSVLTTPDDACVSFEPHSPSSSHPHSVRLPHTVYAQWSRRSHDDPPVFGPLALARQIALLNPKVIYVHLPSKSIDDLPPDQLRFVLEAENAIRNVVNDSHTVDLCSSPPRNCSPKVTLLFDNTISPRKLDQFETLFDTDESFAAASAAAVLSSRFQNITPSSALWSGTLQIPSSDSSGAINLDGLHLIRTNATQSNQPLPPLTSGSARILAVSKQLPSQGGLLNTVPGFSLRLSQNCPRDTALFYNMLASRADSILLSVSDSLFWLFWSRQSSAPQAFPDCLALWIAPLSACAVPALDVAAWAASQNFGNSLSARQLPKHMLDLPVQSISPVTPAHNDTYSPLRRLSDICRSDLRSTVESISKQCSDGSVLGAVGESRRGTTSSDLQLEGVSGAELRVLAKRQKTNPDVADYTMTYGRLTGTHSRSESYSVLEPKSVLGRSETCRQSSQLSMRQQRFQRLLQSQQDKRGVENASTVSSLGQRGKRVRSASDLEISNRRQSKTSRNASSHVYVGQAIREKLRSLEAGTPFFKMDEDKRCVGLSWKEMAEKFAVTDEKWVSSHHSESLRVETFPACHGVEYLCDGDERDKLIIDYETLVSKTDTEFATSTPFSPQQQSKLMVSVKGLRQLGGELSGKLRNTANVSAAHVTSDVTSPSCVELGVMDPSENASRTLDLVLRAFRDGQLVVKDESLRILLMKTASTKL